MKNRYTLLIPSTLSSPLQVGDGVKDHEYWGRPEDMHMARPALKITAQRPGSDVAAETAAALAAGAIAFRKSNPT